MSNAGAVPNHTLDPETGMIESNGYLYAFDSDKKHQFINLFKSNGMGLYRTCRALGMSVSTIHKHYALDPVFRKAFDDAKTEYGDELEATSRKNALNDRSVIERIFQLKALFPDKYGDQKSVGNLNISINVDPQLLSNVKGRQEVLEVEEVRKNLK